MCHQPCESCGYYADDVPSEEITNPFVYLQRNADSDPRGIFSRSPHQTVTNAEALVLAKKVAFEMRRMGVKSGDVVALDLPDQLSALFTEAVFHEAATSTVLPDGYVSDGVFQVDWLFTKRTNPTPQQGARVVHVDAQFLRHVEENPYGISPRKEPIDPLRIVFSSGTTGKPKAMAFTPTALRSFSSQGNSDQRGLILVLMDLGTLAGFVGFYQSVWEGKSYLSVGGANPEQVAHIAVTNPITSLRASPAQIASLVTELERQQLTVPSVQSVMVSGTVMPPGLSERLRRATEGCVVITTYGSTEAKGATARFYESDDPSDAGHLVPGSEIEIVDDEDRVVPLGQVGRIRHRSPGMVHEYLGDPEATASAFKDGWFYPGDRGVIRPDGGLTLRGRESELLNGGGVKIDPTRLDTFALLIPGVTDACSFEYTASSGIQQIGIALVTQDDVDAHEVVAEFTKEFRGASPKLVARVDSIPRNTMGKPMRRTLAQNYDGH